MKKRKSKKKWKPTNSNICNTGEYFIASLLSSNDYITTITLGRAEAYDIIAVRPDGKTAKIQVKTAWYDNKVFRCSPKDTKKRNLDYFYAFVTLKENKEPFDYFIVPAKIVSKSIRQSHNTWLKRGHKDNSVRTFRSKPSKTCPKWYTQELIDSFKNNIRALRKY
ncbi:MAG: hypothetical protein PHV13_04875 [Candidatus ainarchaeum sp.]|nr:hypothetical protein [Candidatus ainarchaeum sp.]